MKFLAVRREDRKSFAEDLDTLIEFSHHCGRLAARLASLNPVEKTKAQLEETKAQQEKLQAQLYARDATIVRAGREKGQMMRRKAGDPIRLIAIAYCHEHPDTNQGSCVKFVAQKSERSEDNVRAIIHTAFHMVEGSRSKSLKPDWERFLRV